MVFKGQPAIGWPVLLSVGIFFTAALFFVTAGTTLFDTAFYRNIASVCEGYIVLVFRGKFVDVTW